MVRGEMMGIPGDLNKMVPEIMQMSKATQTELKRIRELLEELVAIEKRALTLVRPDVFDGDQK